MLLMCSPLCINALAMFWLYLNMRTDRPVLLGIVSSGERQDPVLLVCYQVSVTRCLDTVSTKVLDSVDLNPMRALFHLGPSVDSCYRLFPCAVLSICSIQSYAPIVDQWLLYLMSPACQSAVTYIHLPKPSLYGQCTLCVCVCLYVGRPVSGLFPVSIGQLEP